MREKVILKKIFECFKDKISNHTQWFFSNLLILLFFLLINCEALLVMIEHYFMKMNSKWLWKHLKKIWSHCTHTIHHLKFDHLKFTTYIKNTVCYAKVTFILNFGFNLFFFCSIFVVCCGFIFSPWNIILKYIG